MKLVTALVAALVLAGCGAQPHPAVGVATDAQIAHTDGLMGGFAGKVGLQDGKLALVLVHQGLFAKPVTLEAIQIDTPLGRITTPLYLGTDHQLYGAWADALVPGPDRDYPLGAFVGSPTLGQALRYTLAAGARLDFEKAHDDLLTGKHVPDAAVLHPGTTPKAADPAPALLTN